MAAGTLAVGVFTPSSVHVLWLLLLKCNNTNFPLLHTRLSAWKALPSNVLTSSPSHPCSSSHLSRMPSPTTQFKVFNSLNLLPLLGLLFSIALSSKHTIFFMFILIVIHLLLPLECRLQKDRNFLSLFILYSIPSLYRGHSLRKKGHSQGRVTKRNSISRKERGK